MSIFAQNTRTSIESKTCISYWEIVGSRSRVCGAINTNFGVGGDGKPALRISDLHKHEQTPVE